MISNQAASSANMTGNLFQIFNLPKAGNSSYLFSDIIKIIGTESEGDTVNNLTSSAFTEGGKSLIDSNKLISLLKANINGGSVSEDAGENLTGKYFITEAELTEFINKLGLEGTSEAAKLTSEIAVEVTPSFLNKLSALVNSKPQVHKNIFATIAPEEEKAKEINLSDGEESGEAEGPEKIQVIFKKVSPENDVIAAPQQFIINNEQIPVLGTGETGAEGEFFFGGKAKNIVLGGSKYEFFADTPSGKTQGAQVLSAGETASSENEGTVSVNQGSANTKIFSEVFAEMNASAEAKESAKIPETAKTYKSDGTFFTQEPEIEAEMPEVKSPENIKPVLSDQSENMADTGELTGTTEIKAEKLPIKNSEKNVEGKVEPLTSSLPKEDSLSSFKPESPKSTPDNSANNEALKQTKVSASLYGEKPSDSTSIKNMDLKTTETEEIEAAEPIKNPDKHIPVEKDGLKSNLKAANESNKLSSEKTLKENEHIKETSDGVKENSAGQFTENISGEETKSESGSSFHFSSRFTNEFFRKNNSAPQRNNQVNADSSNIYEISFEKTKPENNYYDEKILPQDFDTSDYETLSSGIFTKTADSFKEFKPVEKTDASAEKNSFKPNEEIKYNGSAEEQASNAGSSPNNGNETSYKPAHKTANEVVFSDHLQQKTSAANETAAVKPVKNYTSLFKEIDAANLVDEIKSFCVRGDKSNITLKLNPEHLGAVKLSIDIKDSVMSTSIEVENESVRQVVQNNIETLRQTLQQNGIQLSSFSVSLSNHQEQKFPGKSGNKKEKQSENEEINLKTEEKPVKTKKLGYNTYEYLA